MADQITSQSSYRPEPADEPEIKPTQPQINPIGEVLDEIDLILEENTQDFVHAFVQKGGE